MSFFDIQVNGYAGIDFNASHLTGENLRFACESLQRDGVNGILIALITDTPTSLIKKISQIHQIRHQDDLCMSMIKGIHLEGPFISGEPHYVGAHNPKLIEVPSLNVIKEIYEASYGLLKLVTLAPEVSGAMEATSYLHKQNVCVSAGHCNPTRDQLKEAIDHGLSMFTHIGNGCPPELPRHDNIIQRALSLAGDLKISLIADGHHLPLWCVKNFIQCAGVENCIITTDAMAGAAAPAGNYSLGDLEVIVSNDGIARRPGQTNLAGATATMPMMQSLLKEQLHYTDDQLHTMMSVTPLKTIGLRSL